MAPTQPLKAFIDLMGGEDFLYEMSTSFLFGFII